MFRLEIDHKKGLPIYLQIVEQVKHQIAIKSLMVGDRLPTVRALAVMLEINPNTVAKAYTELERTGILKTRQGSGTFVETNEGVLSDKEREGKLRSLTTAFVDEALWFGFSREEIIKNIKEISERSETQKKSKK